MREIVPREVGERCQSWIGMNNRCFLVTRSFPVAKNEKIIMIQIVSYLL